MVIKVHSAVPSVQSTPGIEKLQMYSYLYKYDNIYTQYRYTVHEPEDEYWGFLVNATTQEWNGVVGHLQNKVLIY